MNLQALRYLVVLSESQTYAQAAQKLFLSKSALSQAISKLESELGVTLVKRDSAGFAITPAGQTVVDKSRAILGDIESMVNGLLTSQPEHLCLGVQCYSSSYILNSLLSGFKTADASKTVNYDIKQGSYGHMMEAMRGGVVDMTLCFSSASTAFAPGIETVCIAKPQVYCFMSDSDPLAGSTSVRLSSLPPRTVACFSSTQRNYNNRFSVETGIGLRFLTENFQLMNACLMASLGESIFFDIVDWSHVYEGITAVPVDFDDGLCNQFAPHITLCRNSMSDHREVAQRFWDYARDWAGCHLE